MFKKTNQTSSLLSSVSRTVCLLFLCQAIATNLSAQGSLLITPKRVLFDGNKRSEDLNLANTGQDSATYAISFIQIRMKEDGSFERIEAPDSAQLFAEPFLRIFPRQVTLAPNEAQTIKLQVRKTGTMQPGEYRSHLYFRALPKQVPLGEKPGGKDSSISVKLTPLFGISIPVIIRVGEGTAQVQLADVALKTDSIPQVQLTFQRNGNLSVYGDVTVNHVSRQGKTTQVGMARGLAVYTPTAQRRFTLMLDKTAKVDYRSGKLQVLYTESTALSKQVIISEKELLLK